jgi:hypothetical protein
MHSTLFTHLDTCICAQVLDSVWRVAAERLGPGMLGLADTPAAAAQVIG